MLSSGCSSSQTAAKAAAPADWSDTSVNIVSRPATAAGIAAVTSLRDDGTLETVAFDLAAKRKLWAKPATMAGRLAGMGVQPPAVAGEQGKTVVLGVEPKKKKGTLVARDAATGDERWARPVDSTFGPAACGPNVCIPEFTARKKARFAALDPATGKVRWRMPGIAEVEYADDKRVVLLRMARHPSLQARNAKTGKVLWTHAVERSVGSKVNLSGGWSFGSLPSSKALVGYIAPYQAGKGKPLTSFGFFAVRLTDGKQIWARKNLLRIYPGANPAVALVAREVDGDDRYGGFAHLNPGTGQTLAQIPSNQAPKTAWWLAFPPDLSALGFISHGHAGKAYDLRSKRPLVAKKLPGWSFCTVNPKPLEIKGQKGFYPPAALCQFDVMSGKKLDSAVAPPGWYTGAADGWRVWRDERGALHSVKDAKGTAPGMYG